jgi:hypothetical protein
MYSRELEELYSEPNIVNVIKSSRVRRAGHVVQMGKKELSRKDYGQTLTKVKMD